MKRWHWAALIILTIISLIIEFGFIDEHSEHWWSAIPAFYIVFGFAGCVLIIVFSKALGKLFLQKREDYYNDK